MMNHKAECNLSTYDHIITMFTKSCKKLTFNFVNTDPVYCYSLYFLLYFFGGM